MLELIMEKKIIYVLMGIFAAIGVVGKCISNVALRRLVKAAENMNKSTHPLMRLVRAKFEHACMVSEKVENVHVFVDKFIYEYKVMGMRLYSLQRIETISAVMCLILGIAGAFLTYSVGGMSDSVIRTGAAGGIMAVLLYLFHFTTDENFRMAMVKNYMVDYLENVCLHRYEKAYRGRIENSKEGYQREAAEEAADKAEKVSTTEAINRFFEEDEFEYSDKKPIIEEKAEQEPMRPNPGREIPLPAAEPKILPPTTPKPNEVPNVKQPVKASYKQEKPDRDMLIRQILEEFMA